MNEQHVVECQSSCNHHPHPHDGIHLCVSQSGVDLVRRIDGHIWLFFSLINLPQMARWCGQMSENVYLYLYHESSWHVAAVIFISTNKIR